MGNNIEKTIKSQTNPNCLLCGKPGGLIYTRLTDRLLGTMGNWDLRKCPDTNCGLIWLDPMPTKEDIIKAYQNYITHGEDSRLYKSTDNNKLKNYIFHKLQAISRSTRLQQWSKYIQIDNVSPGDLLDIGCGDGKLLLFLKSKGWNTFGQELDARAAQVASLKANCKVYIGELNHLNLSDNTFDLITMSHVIEHVHEPLELFQECFRLLKPKGRLIVVTPNTDSLGHCYFKRAWRGLEPPRHLYIFNLSTLKELTLKSGFINYSLRTTAANAAIINLTSFDFKQFDRPQPQINTTNVLKAFVFSLIETMILLANRRAGEECVLIAEK